jgi:hypothetical protein
LSQKYQFNARKIYHAKNDKISIIKIVKNVVEELLPVCDRRGLRGTRKKLLRSLKVCLLQRNTRMYTMIMAILFHGIDFVIEALM